MFCIFKVQRKHWKKSLAVLSVGWLLKFFLSLVYEKRRKYGQIFSFTWYFMNFFCLCFLHWWPTNKIVSQHPTLIPVGWLLQGRTEYCNDNNNSMKVKWLKRYLDYENLWSLLIEMSIFSFENMGFVLKKKLLVIGLKKFIFSIGNIQVSIITNAIGTSI